MNKRILSVFVCCALYYSAQAQDAKGGISTDMNFVLHIINWQKYDSFLDLLSMRMKTNRNKIVSFAADFKKEYEKIYNRYIDDVSIHQYFVSSNG